MKKSYQKEVMILWFGSEILKDSLLHKAFHQVPILDDTVTNRPLEVNQTAWGIYREDGYQSAQIITVFKLQYS